MGAQRIRGSVVPLIGMVVSITVAICGCVHADLQPIWWGTTVDMASETTTFRIQFDRGIDLFSVDSQNRQADSFQFWVDSVAPNPIERTYDALLGRMPAGTQTVIASGRVWETNQLDVIEVLPADSPEPRDAGGWGTISGNVDYTLTDGGLVSFTVPLSLLRDTDGLFYYEWQCYEYGGLSAYGMHGVSGQAHLTPLPGAVLLGVLGIGYAGMRLRSYS